MVCLGLEPGAAGWKVQTNPLSYSGTPLSFLSVDLLIFDELGILCPGTRPYPSD